MVVARIRQLLESKELTPTQFADLIGVGRPVVSHIMSERNKPSLEVVQRIIDAFPEISLPWLLKGTGNMLDEPEASIQPPSEGEPAPAATPPLTTQNLVNSSTLPLAETVQVQAAAIPVELPLAAIAKPTIVAASAPPAPAAPGLAAAAPIPAPLRPFRAPRFVPGPAAPPTPLPPAELPKPPATVESAAASLKPAPLVPPTVAAAANLPAASAPIEAALPSFLAEPGKAIRRIVIFYRDGSFSDYQPE